ncbi:hypothetical protein DITRI_Ditri01bG0173300 [Diplodiscus trichospermus]
MGEDKKRSRGKVPEGNDSQLNAVFAAIKRWKKSQRSCEHIALFVERTMSEHEIDVEDDADLRNVKDHTVTSRKEHVRRPARPPSSQPCSSSQRPPHAKQKIKGGCRERIMKRLKQLKSSKRKPPQATKPSSKVVSL